MLKTLKIRALVLSIHGALMLLLGLAFLYLRASMTNILFDVLDVGIAILLAVGVFLLAALVDWIAAIGEGANQGIEHFRRFAFYLLAGLTLALAGFILTRLTSFTRAPDPLALLLWIAAAHALTYSISIFALHRRRYRQAKSLRLGATLGDAPSDPAAPNEKTPGKAALPAAANSIIGTISLLFAVTLTIIATRNDDLAAIAILGAYLCFLGTRILIAAWSLHRATIVELRPGARLVHSE